MVNKQVEKRIAELKSEFLLMNRDLREEMSAALREQLRQLEEEETEERSVHHIKLDQEKRMTSRWLREMDEEYKDNIKEDEEDEENSVDLDIFNLTFSETSSDTNSIFVMRKPPNHKVKTTSRNILDASGDADPSDVSNDDSSQMAKCEQDPSDFAETSQSMKKSVGYEEGESSKSHANCFGMEYLRCLEESRVQVDRAKEEEALLTEKQWKEWMDKQEMKVSQKQVKTSDQQSPEKQGGAALPVSEKQMRQNEKGVETMKKIKTYLSDLFNPHTSYKWERFEDED